VSAHGRASPTRLGRASWRATRPIRWAVLLGSLAGLVVAGGGSRIAMRLIALADPSTDGTFTDARATVGEFTMEGTLSLFALGAVAGAMGGLLYLGIRRWLPVPAAWNGFAYSVLTLLTVGNLLFDPSNVDFRIFEPVLLVVALFSVLFFINGLALAGLMDRFHPEPDYRNRPRATAAVTVALGAVCLVGAFGYVGGILGMVEDEGSCQRAVGGGEGCAVPAEEARTELELPPMPYRSV
jgi:hypothetical protein